MPVAEVLAAVAEVAVIAEPHRVRLTLRLVAQPRHPVLLLPVARLCLRFLRHAVLHLPRPKL